MFETCPSVDLQPCAGPPLSSSREACGTAFLATAGIATDETAILSLRYAVPEPICYALATGERGSYQSPGRCRRRRWSRSYIARQATVVRIGWLVGLRSPVNVECFSASFCRVVIRRRCRAEASVLPAIQARPGADHNPCRTMILCSPNNLQANFESKLSRPFRSLT